MGSLIGPVGPLFLSHRLAMGTSWVPLAQQVLRCPLWAFLLWCPVQPQLPAKGLLLDLPSLNTSLRQTISNRTTRLPRLT